jgi:hypothetical protein
MLDYTVNNFAKSISIMLLHIDELCLFMVDEQSFFFDKSIEIYIKKDGG